MKPLPLPDQRLLEAAEGWLADAGAIVSLHITVEAPETVFDAQSGQNNSHSLLVANPLGCPMVAHLPANSVTSIFLSLPDTWPAQRPVHRSP